MTWLEDYGKPIISYRGTSIIKQQYGDFEVIQLSDGRIFCEVGSSSRKLERHSDEFELEGLTEYGYKIKVDQILPMSNNWLHLSDRHSIRAMVLGTISISNSNESIGSPTKNRFFITNFNFWTRFNTTFQWVFNGITLNLYPTTDFKEKIDLIRIEGTSYITTIAEIESTENLN